MRYLVFRAGLPLPLMFLLSACDAILPRRRVPAIDSATVVSTPPTATSVRMPVPASRANAKGAPVDERTAFAALQGGLRRLVLAEEAYFSENGSYTGDLDQIRFRSPAGAAVTMLWATRDGWAARGSYPTLNDKDCVIYVGRTRSAPATKQYRRQAAEGVPVCDVPPTGSRPAGAGAQPVARAGRSRAGVADTASAPDTLSALDAVNPIVQMKVDLRNLARAQELWFGTQGLYSRRTEPFAMQYLWRPGVTLRILSADQASWSAKATHNKLPGKSCIIWYGPVPIPPTTDGQRREASRSAIPACDDA